MEHPSNHSSLSEDQNNRLEYWQNELKSCDEDPADALKMVRAEALTDAGEKLLVALHGVDGTPEEFFEIEKKVNDLLKSLATPATFALW